GGGRGRGGLRHLTRRHNRRPRDDHLHPADSCLPAGAVLLVVQRNLGGLTSRPRLVVACLVALVLGSVLVGLRFHPAPSARDVELEQDQLKPNIAASTGTCGVESRAGQTGTVAEAGLVNV